MNLKVKRETFWFQILILLVSFQSFSKCEEESNEIVSQSNAKSDANLRRALLKALQELENDDDNNSASKKQSSNENVPQEEKTLEKAKASIFSVITDSFGGGKSITITPAPPIRYVTRPPQKHKDNISLHLTSKLTLEEDERNAADSNLLTSSSQNIVFSGIDNKITDPRTRSTPNNRKNNNSIISEGKNYRKTQISTTTTTTTTVQPPTSSTEEHEAKVEDVQFFQAPLVAAFTVHQDEKGLPKRVEPIYKPSTQTSNTKQTKEEGSKKNFYSQQQEEIARLQIALEEKQEALKQQLLTIQKQNNVENYLLQQQVTQNKGQKTNDPQEYIFPPRHQQQQFQTKEPPFVSAPLRQSQPFFKSFGSVSIQQSVSSVPPGDFFLPTIRPPISQPLHLVSFSNLPQQNDGGITFTPSISSLYKEESYFAEPTIYNQQQLPHKEPINFLQKRPLGPLLTEQNISPILSTQLTPPAGLDIGGRLSQFNNRPLRHEGSNNVNNGLNNNIQNGINVQNGLNLHSGLNTQNGLNNIHNGLNNIQNGLNNIQNELNIQNGINVQNGLNVQNVQNFGQFRGNFENYRPGINNQLNHLLRQSGIAETKHAEDFNIVSKILSYDGPKFNNFNSGNNFNRPLFK